MTSPYEWNKLERTYNKQPINLSPTPFSIISAILCIIGNSSTDIFSEKKKRWWRLGLIEQLIKYFTISHYVYNVYHFILQTFLFENLGHFRISCRMTTLLPPPSPPFPHSHPTLPITQMYPAHHRTPIARRFENTACSIPLPPFHRCYKNVAVLISGAKLVA